MKKLSLLLLCVFTISFCQAQQKAVTETGDEVILYDNGTWVYKDGVELLNSEIPTNPKAFKKPEESTFLLKSSKLNVGIYLNPKKWLFQRATENPEAEYELQLKDEDLYAIVISEKIEVPLETLKIIAVENARSVAPDIKIVKEEYRMVNGNKVLALQMNGTMQGIKISYYGYYLSNTNGTIQFLTYTSQNLIDSFRAECDALLNGIVEL